MFNRHLILGFFLVALSACGTDSVETSKDTASQTIPAETAETIAAATQPAADDTSVVDQPKVTLSTNMGDIVLALDEQSAPLSVANFLAYADSGHYAGTIFHRVIANFMIQGGGFDEQYQQKTTLEPIQNEATNGLKNEKYTIAMARTGVVNSATSQFFINVKYNDFLDHRDTTTQGYGYAVFGKVIDGFDVVDAIAALQTGSGGRFPTDVPAQPVIIQSVVRN